MGISENTMHLRQSNVRYYGCVGCSPHDIAGGVAGISVRVYIGQSA